MDFRFAPAARPRRASLRALAGLALSLLLGAAAHAAPTYYVSPHGDDTNDGSRQTPWRTIQHTVDRAGGSATVLVRGGVYHEAVRIRHSGSAGNGYLTVRAYPGERAVLDGSGLAIPDGQFGLFTIADQDYVRIRGFELRHYRSRNKRVPAGIYVSGRGAHIRLLNNRIHHIATHGTNCEANALGIAVYGTNPRASIRDIVIAGNRLRDLTLGCSESLVVNGNVERFTIARNHIHDNNNIGIDVIGFEGVSPDPATDQARDGRIVGNHIHDISSSDNPGYGRHHYAANGIYVDGGRDVIIERNRIERVDIGIELASEQSGRDTRDVTVRNNLIRASRLVGITLGGYAETRGGARDNVIVQNTLYGNDTRHTGSGEFQIQYNARNNVFENNLLVATAQGLLVNHPYPSERRAAVLDYNLYDTRRPAGDRRFVWNGEDYDRFADYRAATGNDRHSVNASPGFGIVRRALDLTLAPLSPAINAGIALSRDRIGATDLRGRPRAGDGSPDIGAFEY